MTEQLIRAYSMRSMRHRDNTQQRSPHSHPLQTPYPDQPECSNMQSTQPAAPLLLCPPTSRAGLSTAYPKILRDTSVTATIQGRGQVATLSSPTMQINGASPSAADMPIHRSRELVAKSCRQQTVGAATAQHTTVRQSTRARGADAGNVPVNPPQPTATASCGSSFTYHRSFGAPHSLTAALLLSPPA